MFAHPLIQCDPKYFYLPVGGVADSWRSSTVNRLTQDQTPASIMGKPGPPITAPSTFPSKIPLDRNTNLLFDNPIWTRPESRGGAIYVGHFVGVRNRTVHVYRNPYSKDLIYVYGIIERNAI